MDHRLRVLIYQMANTGLGWDDIRVKLRKDKIDVSAAEVRKIVLDRDVETAERRFVK